MAKLSPELTGIISQMLKPLKGIPLSLVIEGISGHNIIPFDYQDEKDVKLLSKLKIVAHQSCLLFNESKVAKQRPNEVGNAIENFVKNKLNENGLKAETPTTKKGVHKSTGYPDISFIDEFGRTNYLECKTYNLKNIHTTQRSFYLSPFRDFKVTTDAYHFAISFEISKEIIENSLVFVCKSWKILTLENLLCDIKYEFNSDNYRLYSKSLILAEGSI